MAPSVLKVFSDIVAELFNRDRPMPICKVSLDVELDAVLHLGSGQD